MKKLVLACFVLFFVCLAAGCYREGLIPATSSPSASPSSTVSGSPSESVSQQEAPDAFLKALAGLKSAAGDSFVLVNLDSYYGVTALSGMPELLLFRDKQVTVYAYKDGALAELGGTDTPGAAYVRDAGGFVNIKTSGGYMTAYVSEGSLYFQPFYDSFPLSLSSRAAVEEAYFLGTTYVDLPLLPFTGPESVAKEYLSYLKGPNIPAFDGMLLDLNGDGKAEELSLSLSGSDGYFRLAVNGKAYPGEYADIRVTDIDRADGKRELLFLSDLGSDIYDMKIARYEEGKFHEAVLPEGGIHFGGLGEGYLVGYIRSDLLGTMMYPVKYLLGKNFSFTEVTPAYYPMDVTLTLSKDVTAKMESGEDLLLTAGTQLHFVATDLKSTALFKITGEEGYVTYGELPVGTKTIYVKDDDGKIVSWYEAYVVCGEPQDDVFSDIMYAG